jgi:K+/H+ antiporter YhaU regulatory subunit KhtT
MVGFFRHGHFLGGREHQPRGYSAPEQPCDAGKSIGGLRWHDQSGANILVILQGHQVTLNPSPDLLLAAGDQVLAVATS